MASSSSRFITTNWLLVKCDDETKQYRGDVAVLDLTVDTDYGGERIETVRIKGLEISHLSVASEYALLARTKDKMMVFPSVMVSSVDAFGEASQFISVPVGKPGTHYAVWKIEEQDD